MMGGEDVSGAYLVSYHSSRRRMRKYYQKHFCHLIDICCPNIYLLNKKQEAKLLKYEFQQTI
jgi:hypothetical protein